ncbi:MAG: glycosyltransferase family 9 protein [Chloroflexi bacterium]|nr:glycosyltransferase family 9 protein [Chloroflexota bacterium]
MRDRAVGTVAGALGRAFPQSRPTGVPRSILVLKPCCLGDVVMATPVFASLRTAFPGARIVLGVGRWSRPAVANNPDLSGVLDCGQVGSGPYGVTDYLRLVAAVRRSRFDWCLVLDRSPRLASVPWLAGVPFRAGLDSHGRGFSLQVRVPCPPDRHESEIYLDVARALGVPASVDHVVFRPTHTDERRVGQVAESLGLVPERPLVVIHPGGGTNPGTTLVAKRWPVERYGELVGRLVAEVDATVSLVGGADDAELTHAVRKCAVGNLGSDSSAAADDRSAHGSKRTDRIHDLAGQFSLGELAALAARAAVYVGNDSGPLHLVSGAGARVIGLYGPTEPERYGPFSPRGRGLRATFACDCPRVGSFRACRDHRCMLALEVDAVWDAVLKALGDWRAGR